MHWLHLVRWKNLAIVFFTQLFCWYFLVYDSALIDDSPILLSFPNFLLIACSTVCIAAGGYIINDYFDIRIDIINRPNKVVLEKRIPLRLAIIAHSLLNILALLMAAIVAWKGHHLVWLSVQLSCTLLLWFYSTHFKRQYITGNVVVALLTALTIVTIVIYEPYLHRFLHLPVVLYIHGADDYINPLWMCIGYCFFAFMLTWIREIVKDMEDHIGDSAEGCVTMPIKKGLRFAARFAQWLSLTTLFVLVVICVYLFRGEYYGLLIYTLLLVVLPLGLWCYFVGSKNTIVHYKLASKYLKYIMILGIASLIVYHFTIMTIV